MVAHKTPYVAHSKEERVAACALGMVPRWQHLIAQNQIRIMTRAIDRIRAHIGIRIAELHAAGTDKKDNREFVVLKTLAQRCDKVIVRKAKAETNAQRDKRIAKAKALMDSMLGPIRPTGTHDI